MNIALCDDDEEFICEMEAMPSPCFFRKDRDIHLGKYTDAEFLINDVKSGRAFDVYMPDVETASVNGIDTAKEIIKAAASDPYIMDIMLIMTIILSFARKRHQEQPPEYNVLMSAAELWITSAAAQAV